MDIRGQLIRKTGPAILQELLREELALRYSYLSIEGRDGTGLKTRIPWIRIFHRVLSPSATKGWYVVFLFSADGQAVFLSLNQGTTIIENGTFKNRPKELLLEQARQARAEISFIQNDRLQSEMNLQDPKGLGQQYEYGNVVSFRYPNDSLPDDSLLKEDIKVLLQMLDILYNIELNKSQLTEGTPNLQTQADISRKTLQREEEDTFAALATTIRGKIDDFGTLLNQFLDFSRSSRLDIDITSTIDILASILSSQFLLFAGPSGTGKSSIARLLARFFTSDDAWHILETRRQWIGPEDAFGYYSPLTGHYTLTPNTAGLIDLHHVSMRCLHPKPNITSTNISIPILLIEEANLSPIVHGISSPSTPYVKVQLHANHSEATVPDATYKVPADIFLGPFPRFFGTINVDPTSQAPARKISSRACVILLEPGDRFDPIPAAKFLSTLSTLDTTSETIPQSGQGHPWIGDPASARAACDESELAALTSALADILKKTTNELANTDNEYSGEIISINHRDLERCINYMAYFVRLGEAISTSEIDHATLLTLAAENALLHIILPNLSAYSFRTYAEALLIEGVLQLPSINPNQLGGLLFSLKPSTFGRAYHDTYLFSGISRGTKED